MLLLKCSGSYMQLVTDAPILEFTRAVTILVCLVLAKVSLLWCLGLETSSVIPLVNLVSTAGS